MDAKAVEVWSDTLFRMTGWAKRETDRSSKVWSAIREMVEEIADEERMKIVLQRVSKRLDSEGFVDRQAAVISALKGEVESVREGLFRDEGVYTKAEALADRLRFMFRQLLEEKVVLSKEEIERLARHPEKFAGVKHKGGKIFSPEDVEALKWMDSVVLETMLKGLMYQSAGRQISKAILVDEMTLPAYKNLIVHKKIYGAKRKRLKNTGSFSGQQAFKGGQSLLETVAQMVEKKGSKQLI